MLFAKLHRSHLAHARIVRVDTSEAERVPGVVAVLTGAAMPVPFGILPVSQDEHALALDRVRFVGDPVAAVAATDEDAAFEAAALVRVEYEPLPAVFTSEEALAMPEPRIHDYGDEGNVHKKVALEFGDVEAGFAEADHVADDVFWFDGNTHLPMEQHATLAAADPDGRVTIWSSTQTPHYLHRAASKVLGLPPSRVRIVACPNGGGFGGKSDPFNHEIVVAKLSLMTGRPVKIGLTREEVFYCHRGRHPVLMRFRTGFKKDGSITAMHCRTLLDGGAYGSYGVASTYYTGALQTVTYVVPRYKFDGVRCFTNKPPCGPKRGHGTPQPRFGLEVQLDKAAERLGLDPAAMRLSMLQPPRSLTANFLRVGSMGLGECIRRVVDASGWASKFRQLPRGRGVGIACSSYICGAGLPIYWNALPQSGVTLKVDRGGGVCVFSGETEIGQGSDTVLAQCVAEVLGLDLLDVRVVAGDTDLTPVDLGSYSSRVTMMMGHAAVQAAERARELISKAVAEKTGVPPDRLEFAGGRVFDVSDPSNASTSMPFADAAVLGEARWGTLATVGSYTPPPSAGRYRGAGVGPSPAYSYTAAVVELEASEDTGIVDVKKVWIAHDVGQAIHREMAIGQVEGSVYMGLGEALMEEMAYRGNRFGVHKIPSLLEYKSPTTMEMPEVETVLVEDPDPNGPFGAKEAGQGPLLPVIPAVANALYDALRVRVDEVPISPEKVLRALAAKDRRFGPASFPEIPMPPATRVPTPAEGGTGRALGHETSAGGVRS
jgi:4-hydroxybenzoyl-CoA reductase subunit alpha